MTPPAYLPVLSRRTILSVATAVLLIARPAAAAEPDESTGAAEAEPNWEAHADFAGGATTADVLTEGPPGSMDRRPANVFDSTRVEAYSLIGGVERRLGEAFKLGVRMPFVTATFTSRTGVAEPGSEFVAGNLELEGAYVLASGKSWNLVAILEVALPTAGGNEPPTAEEVAADPARRFDYPRYHCFAAVHAGAAIRGAYESALFEPGNVGLVPVLTATFRFSRFDLSPVVKLENLIDVRGENEEVYINELVAGARAGYRVMPAVEPGLRLWVRELHEHTHADDTYSTVGVVEPYVRFHLGRFEQSVSAILPFAGDLADAKTFGIRAVVAGEL